MTHLSRIVTESWTLFSSAALYFVFGLLVAGFMHAFIRKDNIGKYLGGNRLRSVINAALIGVPLPLCSCGVLPAAVGLRKAGASKAATVSFLISTPESGVDSIAVTYALLGPWMALIRPLAAFVTAFCAGVAEIFFGTPDAAASLPPSPTCCHAAPPASLPITTRLTKGLRYAFVDLLADITPTFLFGILLGGVISSLIPTTFVETYLGTGWQAMLMMLAIGIPLYICASASTPIAAALILKGMSPGAALVFLLAGPATNITALPVIAKALGWRSVAIYLTAIAVCALAFGMGTNLFIDRFAIDLPSQVAHGHHHPSFPALRAAVAVLLLIGMVLASLGKRRRTALTVAAVT